MAGNEAGRGHRGGGHRAPAVADDSHVRALQAGGSDELDEIRRVVAKPVVAQPPPRLAVAGQVRRHHPESSGGERRPDPPPRPRR